jgi:hypothetical protein
MPRTTVREQIERLEAKKLKLEEDLKTRREQLRQRELRKARMNAAKDRKVDTRRKIVLGGLVLTHMERDEAFAVQIRSLMRTLIQDRDRALFSDLFPETVQAAELVKEPANGQVLV